MGSPRSSTSLVELNWVLQSTSWESPEHSCSSNVTAINNKLFSIKYIIGKWVGFEVHCEFLGAGIIQPWTVKMQTVVEPVIEVKDYQGAEVRNTHLLKRHRSGPKPGECSETDDQWTCSTDLCSRCSRWWTWSPLCSISMPLAQLILPRLRATWGFHSRSCFSCVVFTMCCDPSNASVTWIQCLCLAMLCLPSYLQDSPPTFWLWMGYDWEIKDSVHSTEFVILALYFSSFKI